VLCCTSSRPEDLQRRAQELLDLFWQLVQPLPWAAQLSRRTLHKHLAFLFENDHLALLRSLVSPQTAPAPPAAAAAAPPVLPPQLRKAPASLPARPYREEQHGGTVVLVHTRPSPHAAPSARTPSRRVLPAVALADPPSFTAGRQARAEWFAAIDDAAAFAASATDSLVRACMGGEEGGC
jgi:hypothetical protein